MMVFLDLAQAEALDALLSSQGLHIADVILLEVDEEEVVGRLLKRAEEQGQQ
ncbi:MAG: hypothetical protein R2865_13910 [Deinococcales bacterium]